jgi:hypothetical protein
MMKLQGSYCLLLLGKATMSKCVVSVEKAAVILLLLLSTSHSYGKSTNAYLKIVRKEKAQVSGQPTYNISDFGAIADGKAINTKAIQKAIDKCNADGGGQVIVPNGTFVTGTIFLKDNVQLYLNPGTVLKGSNKMADYSTDANCLIAADKKDNIGIWGTGTIDGSGGDPVFYSPEFANGLSGRPNLFSISNCKHIKLKEFTVLNGARWNIHLINSNYISVDDIKVKSRIVANNDGIDLEDCHYITISNSFFDCGDDAICPKSTSSRGVKYLVINNCIIKSESNGIKFGTPGVGGFQDVAITNCTIYDTRLSGIAVLLVDGGTVDRMVISNITMRNVNGGIFIKLGKRSGSQPGVLQNVSINNVIGDGIGLWTPVTSDKYFKKAINPKIGISIVGQPGFLVKNVSLSNVSFQFAGGGDKKDAGSVMPDAPNVYPEFSNFGVTPAYGLNFRHVEGITLQNVKLTTLSPDARPAVFFEDAKDVDISSLKATVSSQASAFVRFKSVENAFIHDCKPQAVPIPFLSFEVSARDISILNNDFHKISADYVKTAEVNEKEIRSVKGQE